MRIYRDILDYLHQWKNSENRKPILLKGAMREFGKELALFTDVPIEPGKTLIIFDEIQMSEGAINSLKYFCEDAPEYRTKCTNY